MLKLFALLCLAIAVRSDLTIETVDDYIKYVKSVNNNTCLYQGETVFLNNDLDFSGATVSSIGNIEKGVFRGTFDGQGHHLSNLNITSQDKYLGLFGLSTYGLTVINVVLDANCVFEGVQSPLPQETSEVHIGGFVGACISSANECSVRNSVNMARVSFSGLSHGPEISIGGIVGDCFASEKRCSFSNAANFGDVIFSGSHTGERAAIGGVVGECDGTTSAISACYVFNSANFGTVAYSGGASGTVYVGGVVGNGPVYVYLTNCVGDGPVVNRNASTTTKVRNDGDGELYMGGIVGSLAEKSIVYASYCGPQNGNNPMIGAIDSTCKDNLTRRYDSLFNLEKRTYVPQYEGTSLVRALNAIVANQNEIRLAQWAGNPFGATLTFIADANEAHPLAVRSERLILMPTPAASSGREFDGWYNEIDLKTLFLQTNVTENKTLYGLWVSGKKLTITFNSNGGDPVSPISAEYGSYISLPTPERSGYTIATWVENITGTSVSFHFRVPARNVTLVAVWAISYIHTPDNFREFVSVVNNGFFSYLNSVVSLESDIDLSDEKWDISPIGSVHYPFKGVFEGNGHVISNLTLSARSRCTALFGYGTQGSVIRNLVLDSSCTVESTYVNTGNDEASNDDEGKANAYLASVLAYCTETNGCNVTNVVSFASISFAGNVSGKLYAGGIVGACSIGNSLGCNVASCSSRGSITVTGSAEELVLGGIIGGCSHENIDNGAFSDDDDTAENDGNVMTEDTGKCSISLTLSSGEISVDPGAVTDRITIGGVVGYVRNGIVKLSASESSFAIVNESSDVSVIRGNILGSIGITTAQRVHGSCATDGNSTGEMLASVSTLGCECFDENFTIGGGTVVDDLNKYSASGTMWVLNYDHHTIEFVVDGERLYADASAIILVPEFRPTSRGMVFYGWYTNPKMTTPFEEDEIYSDITVYGHWKTSEPQKKGAGYIVYSLLGLVGIIIILAVICVPIAYKVKKYYEKKKREKDDMRKALVEDELIFN